MTTKNVPGVLAIAALAACATAAFAIDARLGASDSKDFICKVAPNVGVADSTWSQQRTMSRVRGGDGCPQSWWQQASFSGEKYVTLACDSVRVVAASAEAASQDLYSMYLKNAPQQPAQRNGMTGTNARHLSRSELVQGCEPDPTSTRGVAIKQVNPASARLVVADSDHLATFFSLYAQKVDDESLVQLFNTRFRAPGDAFERREAIAKAASDARAAVKRATTGPFRIETAINVSTYSFDKNRFELPSLEADIQQVAYSYNVQADAPLATMPNYALTVSASLKAGYQPANTDEAKRIERARVASAYNLKAVVLVQPTKAWMNAGRPVLNALVSRIDVADGKGNILFSLLAK